MKYVILTKADANGISEVFHSVVLPEGAAPAAMIERWNTLVSSPVVVGKVFEGKTNLRVGSRLDEESQELTLPEGISSDEAFAIEERYFALLIDNVVTTTMKVKGKNSREKFTAAFADPVIVIGLNEDHLADIGYTYNGSTFSAPVTA
jgi:hypothetical protein